MAVIKLIRTLLCVSERFLEGNKHFTIKLPRTILGTGWRALALTQAHKNLNKQLTHTRNQLDSFKGSFVDL